MSVRTFGTVGGFTMSPSGLDQGAGGAPRNGDNASLSSSVSGTTLKLVAPSGQYDGVDDTVTIADADFVASKILSGANIFGIDGTAKRSARATNVDNGNTNGVFGASGLGFTPSCVVVEWYRSSTSTRYRWTYKSDGNSGFNSCWEVVVSGTSYSIASGYSYSVGSGSFSVQSPVSGTGSNYLFDYMAFE